MPHDYENRYSAYKLTAIFQDDIGTQKIISGTAFCVQLDNGGICIVTNRHNCDLDYNQKTSKYKDFKRQWIILEGRDSEGNLNSIILNPFQGIKFSDTYENDIACILNPKIFIPTDGVAPKPLCYLIPIKLFATEEQLKTKLSICDFVAFPGYPEWHDQLEGRPILRTGTIASDPRYNYSNSKNFMGDCIAYEAFSTGGSSGSPIFALEKGVRGGGAIVFSGYRELLLIGINSGHLYSSSGHSGISYMYKSSAILDVIKDN